MYLFAFLRRRRGPTAPAAPTPVQVVLFPKPETRAAVPQPPQPAPPPVPAPVVPPPAARPPAPPPSAPLVPDVADIAGSLLGLAGGNLRQLGAGAQLLTDVGKAVVSDVLGAGKGRAEVLTVAPAGAAMAVAQLTRNALNAVGVKDERLVKPLEQAAALGPLAPSVLLVHVGREALKAVAPEAEKAASNVVKLADFTDPKQPAGQALAAANKFISDVLLGSKPPAQAAPPPPPPPPKNLADIRYTLAAVANARARREPRGGL